MSKKSIAVDFDGVLHGYSEGYKDGSIYDEPVSGAKKAMEILSKHFEIIIFSARNHDKTIDGKLQKNQAKEVGEYLDKHEIPYDKIHTESGKPHCKLFIDDNAYRFEGNWTKALVDVLKILEKQNDRT